MKFNKWTLGLAAVGVVSMASTVRAVDEKLVPLNTAVSSTTISGYVDVAAQYNAGDPSGSDNPTAVNQPFGLSTGKVDGFSLNDVVISLDKPLDESPWAAGYHIDLNWGADAVTPVAGTPVRQAYVVLRTPVGNGIDWKVGGFDGVTGYEGNTGYANPNYTRSYAYQINPASELGLLASYKVVDGVAFNLGMAQRGTTFAYAGQAPVSLSSKDYIATMALTAPESWGWLKGSTLNAGTVQGFDNGAVNNYSVNATIATPVTGFKVGLAFDAAQTLTQNSGFAPAPIVPGAPGSNVAWQGQVYGLYLCYQATEKLAFNLRGEYADPSGGPQWVDNTGVQRKLPTFQELTATVEYDLWANVVSRMELRWDHAGSGVWYNGGSGTGAPSVKNSYMLALNLVYKF
jgi:hypothetical protein